MEQIAATVQTALERAREAQRFAQDGGEIVFCERCRADTVVGSEKVCPWCEERMTPLSNRYPRTKR